MSGELAVGGNMDMYSGGVRDNNDDDDYYNNGCSIFAIFGIANCSFTHTYTHTHTYIHIYI
jgi:hypothetical protein